MLAQCCLVLSALLLGEAFRTKRDRRSDGELEGGPWANITGPCSVDSTGCVTSQNYPADYGPNERCQIDVEPAYTVSAEDILTERCCDKLFINGEAYSGRISPQDVYPLMPITWSSDASYQSKGWRLCASPSPTPPPTPAPTPAPPPYEGPCGAKGPDDTPWIQIVNGQKATRCEWKWQASLRWGSSPGGAPFCGGTLIDENWVMTAAHCMEELDEGSFTVRLGDYDRFKLDSASVDRRVKKIFLHPSFNQKTFQNDLALLELSSPVPMTDCIGKACLPGVNEKLDAGKNCWITGWGTLYEQGGMPGILQEGLITTISNSQCSQDYDRLTPITSDMVCAHGKDRDGYIVDACQGDSGGPLVCDAGGGRYVLHGAVSFGNGCARKGSPGVYARVHHELSWVQNVTGL